MGTKGKSDGTKELLALYRKSQDPEAAERLVVDHLALVKRLCWRFHSSGEPQEDLIQVGTIGLLKAIKKFDPELGSSFISFAVPVIVGEIKNYFRDHGWAVKVPRKLQSQKMAVDRAVVGLTQNLGHTPTVPEIAEDTGFSIEEVAETFEVERFGKPLSLDAQYESDDSEDVSSILDYMGVPDADLEGLADRVDLELALDGVDSREQAIIYLKFYSGLSQSAIAKRLGISQMHVSRLQRTALNKLKSSLIKQSSA
ncbi:MAG: SigB/SigF/SigG family RNA polymerase sigma factor [Dehalococcoidia bacterium]|nr:SigB/SigF/SigG family RNA polymerase sigma factor [Dehalococcoidia bacterium]